MAIAAPPRWKRAPGGRNRQSDAPVGALLTIARNCGSVAIVVKLVGPGMSGGAGGGAGGAGGAGGSRGGWVQPRISTPPRKQLAGHKALIDASSATGGENGTGQPAACVSEAI
eukprot:1669041-Prymnesium_polylepis.4